MCFSSCKEDNKRVSNEEILSNLDEISGDQGFESIYQTDTINNSDSAKSDTNGPEPTNEKEKSHDQKRIEILKEDLKESKYNNCQDIIIDYEIIIEALKKGNTKPLKEFPLDKDPKIAICRSLDLNFAQKLDSLQDVSSKILDNM